jgi:hypothetical protein
MSPERGLKGGASTSDASVGSLGVQNRSVKQFLANSQPAYETDPHPCLIAQNLKAILGPNKSVSLLEPL